jgi:5'-phosphate synthase pdxT subunit
VIPGGESTTIVRLCDTYGLRRAICEAAADGLALWGTCAGMIVLARALTDPYPVPFGLVDIEVSRNSFGRQVDSFEIDLDIRGIQDGPFRGIFIRAPGVVSVGAGVEVLAVLEDGTPVAVCSERVLATAFHPELGDDTRVHKLFLARVERCRNVG